MSPVWLVLSSAAEAGSWLGQPWPLDLSLFEHATGRPRPAVWLLLRVATDAALAAAVVLIAHEIAQWRAWRAVARSALTALPSGPADEPGPTPKPRSGVSSSSTSTSTSTSSSVRAGPPEEAAAPDADVDAASASASSARSWVEWRAEAAGSELCAAVSQPFASVVPVPRWWLAREHTAGPLLAGLAVALHPALLAAATVGGQGLLAELVMCVAVLQVLRSRPWAGAIVAGGVVALLDPRLGAGAGAMACVWAWRGGRRGGILSAAVSAGETAIAGLVAAVLSVAICWASAPATTLAWVSGPISAPSAAVAASPLWYLAVHALPDFQAYFTALPLVLGVALPVLTVVAAVPRGAGGARREAAPGAWPAEVPVEWAGSLLALPFACSIAGPEASIQALAFGLCLLLAELRVASQWRPSMWALLAVHFAWVVVVVAARQWGTGGGGAAANTLFAGQLLSTVAGGMVLTGWVAAAARYGRALELAQAVMPARLER